MRYKKHLDIALIQGYCLQKAEMGAVYKVKNLRNYGGS